MKKLIGNALLIGGLICFFIAMICLISDYDGAFRVLVILYAVGVLGGAALRFGDFLKWIAKKFQQGVNEANQPVPAAGAKFCSACGKPLSADAAFCPGCGKKVN